MTEPDVWKTIENDAFYRQFIYKDVKTEAVTQGLAVSEQLKKLTDCIALLDVELQKQVLANHDNLLSQATWIEKLENVLYVMQSHVQCLLSAVERLRNKVVEPFNKIEMQTVVLARLQATSDLLRRVSRTQSIVKRLNVQMKGTNMDIVKASQCINELDQLCEDVDLTGLEVLDADLKSVRTHRSELESRARSLINQGLTSSNPTQVGTAIHVFHDLGTLDAAVMQIIDNSQSELSAAIKQALDIQTLTQPSAEQAAAKARAGTGGPGRVTLPANVSLFRSRLWSSLERLFDSTLFYACERTQVLQTVLAKQCCDLPGGKAAPGDENAITENYWQIVNALLGQHLGQAAQGSSFVKQALEGEYPKFLHLYLDLCKRLNTSIARHVFNNQSQAAAAKVGQTYSPDRAVTEQFENAYLSRSVSRLLDPVHQMFSDSVPTTEEVDALIRTVSSELSVSLVDVALSKTVAKNISKTVRLFCLKCEQMSVTTGEATQVIDSPTAGQTVNVNLANLLHYLCEKVSRVLLNMNASLPVPTQAVVTDSLANIDALVAANIVQPLLASVGDAIEAIVFTIHNEDFSLKAVPANVQCSLYMKELQGFIARSVSSYLAPFHDQKIVGISAQMVASRCLDLFVRHACLVRPLEEGGRAKLAADFTQMELAIAPLVGGQLSDIGSSYRVLRSFRPLILETIEQVADSPALGDVIPFSLILLSLFARGPTELLSPHVGANWSISRLSQWLDTHMSERDRLELISGAIQKYQQTVRQKGDTKFHPVYPVMVALLERGIEYNNAKRK